MQARGQALGRVAGINVTDEREPQHWELGRRLHGRAIYSPYRGWDHENDNHTYILRLTADTLSLACERGASNHRTRAGEQC